MFAVGSRYVERLLDSSDPVGNDKVGGLHCIRGEFNNQQFNSQDQFLDYCNTKFMKKINHM